MDSSVSRARHKGASPGKTRLSGAMNISRFARDALHHVRRHSSFRRRAGGGTADLDDVMIAGAMLNQMTEKVRDTKKS